MENGKTIYEEAPSDKTSKARITLNEKRHTENLSFGGLDVALYSI